MPAFIIAIIAVHRQPFCKRSKIKPMDNSMMFKRNHIKSNKLHPPKVSRFYNTTDSIDTICLNNLFVFNVGNELTSWEAYNYILYGFVNELIQLGCKDELMTTTLQLWAAYLRKNEVAFFGKKETHLPKFSFKYNQRDVRLVYSLPIKKRRTSSAAASSASGDNMTYRQSKIALGKKRVRQCFKS